jgi:hypothetical protein
MKNKLKLKDISVKSFVTNFKPEVAKTIKGGVEYTDLPTNCDPACGTHPTSDWRHCGTNGNCQDTENC